MDLHPVLDQTKLQNLTKISKTKGFHKTEKTIFRTTPHRFYQTKEKKGSKPKLKFLSEIEKQTTLV
jgi:hypothetical protein